MSHYILDANRPTNPFGGSFGQFFPNTSLELQDSTAVCLIPCSSTTRIDRPTHSAGRCKVRILLSVNAVVATESDTGRLFNQLRRRACHNLGAGGMSFASPRLLLIHFLLILSPYLFFSISAVGRRYLSLYKSDATFLRFRIKHGGKTVISRRRNRMR